MAILELPCSLDSLHFNHILTRSSYSRGVSENTIHSFDIHSHFHDVTDQRKRAVRIRFLLKLQK
jgi:hypothetical protein